MPYHLTCHTCGKAVTRTRLSDKTVHCSFACKFPVPPFVPNGDGETASIPILARDGSLRAYAIVDIADAGWVNQWRWSLSHGYPMRAEVIGGKRVSIRLHRELFGLPRIHDGREGEHQDRDRLNCRRSNLRIAPHAGNLQNLPSHRDSLSRFRGVSWDKVNKKWRAQVRVQGRSINIGRFLTEEEAAQAAREARIQHMPYAID